MHGFLTLLAAVMLSISGLMLLPASTPGPAAVRVAPKDQAGCHRKVTAVKTPRKRAHLERSRGVILKTHRDLTQGASSWEDDEGEELVAPTPAECAVDEEASAPLFLVDTQSPPEFPSVDLRRSRSKHDRPRDPPRRIDLPPPRLS